MAAFKDAELDEPAASALALPSAVRDFRAGTRDFFVSGRPGPRTAPAKDAARPRIIELRAAGHSIDEIARALAAEGTPLNRTGIAEVIAGQELPRMWRRPDAERGGAAREIQARAEAVMVNGLGSARDVAPAGLGLVPIVVAAFPEQPWDAEPRRSPGNSRLSASTRPEHVSQVLGKLGAANRTEAVTRAMPPIARWLWLSPDLARPG